MALRHAVLAALLEGEASGYELSKRFDVSVANFWSATPQQLYRELEGLESGGLLAAHVVEQQRRPNKRVFSLTESGRDELFAFTQQPARPLAIRDDLLVKLQALDAEAVVIALAERREHARAKLELYDRLRDRMLAGRSEAEYLLADERVGPYLTLMGGRMFEQQNLRWITNALEILEQRSGRNQGTVASGLSAMHRRAPTG
jgi:DNA-binding PadR family transcriptional regulator